MKGYHSTSDTGGSDEEAGREDNGLGGECIEEEEWRAGLKRWM